MIIYGIAGERTVKTVYLSYPLPAEVILEHTQPQVAAIGQFDGVHLGHASVISSAVNLAKGKHIPSAVMTFHPHPKDVMKKGDYEGSLTPLQEKQELLAGLGVDIVYVVEFNDSFSHVSPQEFVEGMLFPLGIEAAVVGFDFRFGHKGEGNAEMLRLLGNGRLDVEVIPPFELEGGKVSSTEIRKALQRGDLERAGRLLGRSYRLRGTVVGGEKRGRTIGFPTANLKLDDKFVIPVKGVYAVRAFLNGRIFPGVMNVGVKPTFHENETVPSFEVHLFDFDREIYGEHVTVELVHFIRNERKFPSVPELIAQIQADADRARELLKSGR